jgi:hypothetical protein
MYRANLKIRKIRISRIDLMTTTAWLPLKNILRKVGVIARKSMIPRKLKIYLKGFGDAIILAMYSIENIMVNIHSTIFNSVPYSAEMDFTLSSITARILRIMVMSMTTSNILPHKVSVPKMRIFIFCLQPLSGASVSVK